MFLPRWWTRRSPEHPGHSVMAHGTDGELAAGMQHEQTPGWRRPTSALEPPMLLHLMPLRTEHPRLVEFFFVVVYFEHFLPISVKMFTFKLWNENA